VLAFAFWMAGRAGKLGAFCQERSSQRRSYVPLIPLTTSLAKAHVSDRWRWVSLCVGKHQSVNNFLIMTQCFVSLALRLNCDKCKTCLKLFEEYIWMARSSPCFLVARFGPHLAIHISDDYATIPRAVGRISVVVCKEAKPLMPPPSCIVIMYKVLNLLIVHQFPLYSPRSLLLPVC